MQGSGDGLGVKPPLSKLYYREWVFESGFTRAALGLFIDFPPNFVNFDLNATPLNPTQPAFLI